MQDIIDRAMEELDLAVVVAYVAGNMDQPMPTEKCREHFKSALNGFIKKIKKQRAEFVKELEGIGVPDVPGEDMEAWRACNRRWRKQRDTLINKYKEV